MVTTGLLPAFASPGLNRLHDLGSGVVWFPFDGILPWGISALAPRAVM